MTTPHKQQSKEGKKTGILGCSDRPREGERLSDCGAHAGGLTMWLCVSPLLLTPQGQSRARHSSAGSPPMASITLGTKTHPRPLPPGPCLPPSLHLLLFSHWLPPPIPETQPGWLPTGGLCPAVPSVWNANSPSLDKTGSFSCSTRPPGEGLRPPLPSSP